MVGEERVESEGESQRPYVVIATDGDRLEDTTRGEAFEWADEHLDMLETLESEGIDHWMQINSYSLGFGDGDG